MRKPRSRKLSKLMQLLSDRSRTRVQVYLTPKPELLMTALPELAGRGPFRREKPVLSWYH